MNKKISTLILLTLLVLSTLLMGCKGNNVENTEASVEIPSENNIFPEKPVKMIIPMGPGGGSDIGNRMAAKYAEPYLGQPFVCENIEGGGGEIGVSTCLRAEPDGYTISGFVSANVVLTYMREAQYDIEKDVQPISLIVSDPRLFLVRADDERFPDAQAFIEYAKNNPNELTIGTSGAGTSGHLSILTLNKFAGVEAKPVHFGGAGESKAAFLGGHIDALAQTVGEVLQMVKDGEGKVVALATDERMEELPNVPTFKEIGVDMVVSSNRGFVCPKGTPKEVVEKIADSLKKACEDPGMIEEMGKIGFPIKYLGPEEYTKLIEFEMELYEELVKELQ